VIVDCAEQIEPQVIMIGTQTITYLEEKHGVINEDDADMTGEEEDDKMRVNFSVSRK
jgi:hypothetical protein